MNTPPDPLDPLFRWSRAAPRPPAPVEPPPGFATRVLAELRGEWRRSPWEFLALRSLPLAALAAALCLLFGPPRPDRGDDPAAIARTMIQQQIADVP